MECFGGFPGKRRVRENAITEGLLFMRWPHAKCGKPCLASSTNGEIIFSFNIYTCICDADDRKVFHTKIKVIFKIPELFVPIKPSVVASLSFP